MTPDEIDNAESIRAAFKAGFTAVLEPPTQENGLTQARWTFLGFNVASDLEVDAWDAWQRMKAAPPLTEGKD